MADLWLTDTMGTEKRRFAPIDPDHVRFYVCGPTVYNLVHIGNARPVVVFDMLFRVLKALYPTVTYARNITDIDDKIMVAAREKASVLKQFRPNSPTSSAKTCARSMP